MNQGRVSKHINGTRGRLYNRKKARAAKVRDKAFMARYREAMRGRVSVKEGRIDG